MLNSKDIYRTFKGHLQDINRTFTGHLQDINRTFTLHSHYIYILTERPVVLSNAIFQIEMWVLWKGKKSSDILWDYVTEF